MSLILLLYLLLRPSMSLPPIDCVHCPEYVEASAATKEAILMDKIVASEYETLPPNQPFCSSFEIIQEELDAGMDVKHIFDRFSDERDAALRRFFHFQGAVAAVRFEADPDSPFTGSSLLSHPMMIFDFGNNQHLCFSVEVRYRANQNYSFLKGIYRQYELMYVVTDERDAILRRTRYAENQDCYLYRLRADQPGIQQLFREYADAANELATHPRWYHAITDNCTTTIIKRRVEKVQFDLRFYMNGSLDKLLYERELIDTSLPFSELKARSHINESANSATPEEFSQAIRMNLPGYESREFEH